MVPIAHDQSRFDPGRLASRILCALFALIGSIPLLAAFLVRSTPVQQWAASETARLLRDELGIDASYNVALDLVPFRLTISDIVVPGADRKGPVMRAEEIQITPRVFSLLAGELDAGDIEIERPELRLVFRDGKLQNLKYELKQLKGRSDAPERAPFASLAMTEAKVDVVWDDVELSSGTADVDVFAEPGLVFEAALRLAEGTLTATRSTRQKHSGKTRVVFDEDALCRADLRLSRRPGEVTIRRLSLLAVADDDPARDTRPSCALANTGDDSQRVAARISSLRLGQTAAKTPNVNGHVMLRFPARLGRRLDDALDFDGWLGFSGDVSYDGSTRLPQLSGHIQGAALELDDFAIAHELEADLQIAADAIRVPKLRMKYADADVTISGVRIAPLEQGVPITVESVDNRGMTFPGLMRDLDVTDHTIVHWDIDSALVKHVRGTLAPLALNAEISAETSNFEVSHGAFDDPARTHMVGVDRATVRGSIKVSEDAFQLVNTRARFGNSSVLVKLVSIGFDDRIKLIIPKGGKIDLKDISPLAKIPLAGQAEVEGEMDGEAPNLVLTGNVGIRNFDFGGFPLGDILSSKFKFVPLKLDLSSVVARKGDSSYTSSSTRIDFESDASVQVDALVESSSLDLRDFLAMWKFEQDPRWTHLKGHGKAQARIHYLLGGRRDRCGHGNLKVLGSASLDRMEAFEENYDSGLAEFDLRWADFEAGYRGFSLDVPGFTLTKGSGTLAGSVHIDPGAKISGNVAASRIPIAKIDALGEHTRGVEGSVTTAVVEMGGSLDAFELSANAALSPLRIGKHTLPASEFSVRLEPRRLPHESVGTSACGQPIAPEFDRARWERDETEGRFLVSGQLFDHQVSFQDLELTSQRDKVWKGRVELSKLDLAAPLELLAPGSAPDFTGLFSGSVDIEAYPLKDPAGANLVLTMRELDATQAGVHAQLVSDSSMIKVSDRSLDLSGLGLAVTTPGGQSGVFDVRGHLGDLGRDPTVEAELTLRPTDLSAFTQLIPKAERAQGRVNGTLSVRGRLSQPNVRGGLSIANGEVELEGLKSPLTDLNVQVQVDPTQIQVVEGTARMGSGKLRLTGRAPIQGTSIGTARADLEVQGMSLTLEDGIRVTLDSRLSAVYQPGRDGEPAPLPRVDGNVTVTSFDYTRPMSMTADLSNLAKRGRRTEVESYDPSADALEFDIQLRSLKPLHIENELLDTELVVDNSGLRLKGTNQRFGMLGRLKLKPGGQIKLRSHDFEIRQGWVRFDDLSRIEPHVDVTAVTDYRRFEDVSGPEAANGASVSTGNVGSSSLGGQWRINLHAYGDPENLKIDLTSTPNLPQDDIFLLLTVGLTRAELDQNRSAAVGSSVALEALGTLSGADRAVRDAVPVIDDASMGSSYNPKSGRTEPTITIGKRLAEKIRAQVTTGLSDSSKVESSLRWQMNPQVSVEGSYGNVNDISSSSLGNVGADIRWRLEFD